CTAALASARSSAAAFNSSGMIKSRASITAIASMTSASAAPSNPDRPGTAQRLATTLPIASAATATMARREEPCARRSRLNEIAVILLRSRCPKSPLLRSLADAVRRFGRAEPPAQLGAQLLGNVHGVDTVADDLRPDKDDQLGTLFGLVGIAEELAELAELVDQRQSRPRGRVVLADQAGEQHGLPIGDRDRALDAPLRDRRRQAAGAAGCGVRDFLLNVEQHVAVRVDARHDAQDDAGVAIVDGVDHRVV